MSLNKHMQKRFQNKITNKETITEHQHNRKPEPQIIQKIYNS